MNGTGEDECLLTLRAFTTTTNTYKIRTYPSLIAIIVLFLFLSTGSCVDSLNYNRGAAFSTKDKDSDTYVGSNCAKVHQGAWWYKSCTQTNLNGLYSGHDITGIYWHKTQNGIVLLKRVEMKLELVN